MSEYEAISSKFICVGVKSNLFETFLLSNAVSIFGESDLSVAATRQLLLFLLKGPLGLKGHRLSG